MAKIGNAPNPTITLPDTYGQKYTVYVNTCPWDPKFCPVHSMASCLKMYHPLCKSLLITMLKVSKYNVEQNQETQWPCHSTCAWCLTTCHMTSRFMLNSHVADVKYLAGGFLGASLFIFICFTP